MLNGLAYTCGVITSGSSSYVRNLVPLLIEKEQRKPLIHQGICAVPFLYKDCFTMEGIILCEEETGQILSLSKNLPRFFA